MLFSSLLVAGLALLTGTLGYGYLEETLRNPLKSKPTILAVAVDLEWFSCGFDHKTWPEYFEYTPSGH